MQPLMQAQAAELVRAAAPALSDAHVKEIVARTGGNPLYLEMLSSAYARMTEGEEVPASLQTAIVARVDDLDETSRAVLREASIFGHSFLEEPLKLITGAGAGLYESLAHLSEVGLIDEQPRANGRAYAFRHSLVQQVLIEGMLRARRQSLHLAAAEALELVQEEGIDVEPEQIAYHFAQAGDTQRAATYHLASAERADRMGARSEARQHRRTANRLLSLTSLADL
jgi:predicted ATPase